ncbi:MAG: hypothetical protein ACREGE_02605 [Candidatus Microsaccharimonas sp.]
MPKTLFPGDERQDEKNIGQEHADRRFNDLAGAEKRGTVDMSDFERNYGENADSSQEDASIERARRGESEKATGAPDAEFRNNVQGRPSKQRGRFKGWFKKASPALGIGGGIGIGGLILMALTSPSLLFFQLNSTMLEKFNTQLASMETRSNKLLMAKIDGSTKGFCSSAVSIRCKYTTLSDKQLEKFKKAGIEVVPDEKKSITGRTKPLSYTFKGQSITANNFTSVASTNAEFRSALRQAYNPKYAGLAGKAWSAVATKFKISKTPPELGAEDESRTRQKLATIAREGFSEADLDTSKIQAGDKIDPDCKEDCRTYSEEEARNARAIEADAKSGATGNKVSSALSDIGGEVAKAGNVFKITGIVDDACMGYAALNGLTYAAKTIRAAQLVRYAMIYLSISDAIKAGESPSQKDIEFLGNTLTATKKDPNDLTKTLVGSATDSFGYKYAAYGDSSASQRSMDISNRFMAGGGLVGEISQTSTYVLSFLGGNRGAARSTCAVLGNPFVQAGSLLAGVAMLFVPGANVAKMVGSAAVHVTIAVAISMLPALLADIVAGSVTEDISGEEAGNAITSGSGKLLSDSLAGQNGAAPMTKDDALAYNSLQTQTTNQYIADELENTSPFDATNPHTFIGSIASTLLPLQSSSNPITSIASLLASSVKGILPQSSAASDAEYEESLNVCNDLDVQEAQYAADPFCNVIRAIPPQYLNRDPIEVATQLIDSGLLGEGGVPQGAYAEFVDKCITSLEPLGYAEGEQEFNPDNAKECIIDSENANYYLNYMDSRIEAGMSGEEEITEESQSGTGRPANTTDRGGNGGWTLTNNVDYSSTQCDPRTTDAGVYTSPQYGWTIRLCQVTLNTSVSGDNGGNSINSLVSTNAMNMFEAAAAEGVTLGLSDGMRKRPPSYFSMHSTGLAMDLGTPRGGATICYGGSPTNGYGSLENAERACAARGGEHYKAYTWLRANAGKHGFFNFDKEPWHYSTSGNGV